VTELAGVASKQATEEETNSNAGQDKLSSSSDGTNSLAAVVEKDGNAVHDDGVVTAGVASKQAAEQETRSNAGQGNLSSTSDLTTSLPSIVEKSSDAAPVTGIPTTTPGPLYNPPTAPTTTGGVQCSSTLPDTVRELRVMEALVKEKKRQFAHSRSDKLILMTRGPKRNV
jgi:hypothetical protein